MAVITVGGVDHEDSDSPQAGGPRRQSAILAVVGLVTGLTIGIVFAGGQTEPTTTSTTPGESVITPSASPTTTTTTTLPSDVARLATLAPGLTDTLVMVSINSTGVASVTVWEPAGRAPQASTLPVGQMEADASRQWLAELTTSRYADQQTLWVGNAMYMEPLVIGPITGMVWHARLPGEIAWVEWDGRESRLRTAEIVAGRSAVPRTIATLDEPAVPVWWNDDGIVLSDHTPAGVGILTDNGSVQSEPTLETETLHLVDLDGVPVAETQVRSFVAGSNDLAAIVALDGTPALLSTDLDTAGPAPWDADCTSGSFAEAPPGQAVAMLCDRPTGSTLEVWVWREDAFQPLGSTPVENASDPGFTADATLAYAVTANPLRPSSELVFLRLVDGEILSVTHPGRVTQMEALRN